MNTVQKSLFMVIFMVIMALFATPALAYSDQYQSYGQSYQYVQPQYSQYNNIDAVSSLIKGNLNLVNSFQYTPPVFNFFFYRNYSPFQYLWYGWYGYGWGY